MVAIGVGAKEAGLNQKGVPGGLHAARAQFSRWTDDKGGITWAKLRGLMDVCGNDAPLWWMLHTKGYELTSLRKRETETEQALRIERERRIKAEERVRYFEEVMTGRMAA